MTTKQKIILALLIMVGWFRSLVDDDKNEIKDQLRIGYNIDNAALPLTLVDVIVTSFDANGNSTATYTGTLDGLTAAALAGQTIVITTSTNNVALFAASGINTSEQELVLNGSSPATIFAVNKLTKAVNSITVE